jgi:hypothetical protein
LLALKGENMKKIKKSPILVLGLALFVVNSQALDTSLPERYSVQSIVDNGYTLPLSRKEYCSKNNMICFTPYLNNNSLISSDPKHTLDLQASAGGGELKNPETGILVSFKASIIPLLQYDSVHDEYNEKVEKAVNAAASEEIKSGLLAAGIPEGSSLYDTMYSQYFALAVTDINSEIKKYEDEGQRRLDIIQLQDTFQEVVIGLERKTFIFRVGKFVAGTGFEKNAPSEASLYVADSLVTDKAITNQFPGSNVEIAKIFDFPRATKLTLIAFAGQEGRLFISAVQDTMNALSMSTERFDEYARLININSYGLKAKFRFINGHELIISGITGPNGITGGAEIRVPISKQLIAHLAYVYAQKQSLYGNQISAQLDYHIGIFYGIEIIAAGFFRLNEGVEDSSVVPDESTSIGTVSSKTGGVALTAKKYLGYGAEGSATLQVSESSAIMDDTGESALSDGFAAKLKLNLNFIGF